MQTLPKLDPSWEKMHEQLISIDESRYTYEFSDYYKILSPLNNWTIVKRENALENVFSKASHIRVILTRNGCLERS